MANTQSEDISPGSSNAGEDTDFAHGLASLKDCLTSEEKTIKAPKGLDSAIRAFASADDVTRAFLKRGFREWYAYHVATLRNKTLRQTVSRLSPAALEHVAAELARTEAHESVDRRIRHILFKSNRHQRRLALLRTHDIALPDAERLSPQQRLGLAESSWSGDSSSTSGNDHVMTRRGETTLEADENTINPISPESQERSSTASQTVQGSEYSWPKAQNLPFIFPHHTCAGIAKEGDLASVTAYFPPDPSLCCLVVDISAKEAQSLSRDFFRAQVRHENSQMLILFDDGVLAEIKGSVTFKGADAGVIDKILGQAVGNGFRHSAPRLREASLGVLYSNCLTMEVWADSSRPVRLKVTVDALGLDYIRQKLWDSTSPTSQ